MPLSTTRTRAALAASLAAVALGLAACSSSSSPASSSSASSSSPAAAGAPASSVSSSMPMPMPSSSSNAGSSSASTASGITIKDFGFTGELTVKAGEKITVTNMDSVAHTLTDKKTHLFDTGNIPANGGTGTFTAPTTPGSYAFGCTYHPEMAGTLVVTS